MPFKNDTSPPTIIVCENRAGAAVEVHEFSFTSTWHPYLGAPHAASAPYRVDGFNWRCRGCSERGRERETYADPGFKELHEARTEAQQHATACSFKQQST